MLFIETNSIRSSCVLAPLIKPLNITPGTRGVQLKFNLHFPTIAEPHELRAAIPELRALRWLSSIPIETHIDQMRSDDFEVGIESFIESIHSPVRSEHHFASALGFIKRICAVLRCEVLGGVASLLNCLRGNVCIVLKCLQVLVHAVVQIDVLSDDG